MRFVLYGVKNMGKSKKYINVAYLCNSEIYKTAALFVISNSEGRRWRASKDVPLSSGTKLEIIKIHKGEINIPLLREY